MKKLVGAAVALLAMLEGATAHSWVEQVMKIAPDGSFTDDFGFPRNFIPRDAPGFNDGLYVHHIPPNDRKEGPVVLPSDLISKYPQDSYTKDFAPLNASAGDMVALRYQENGHVSQPNTPLNKPHNRGTIFVYGTSQAKDDDKLLDIVGKWTADGKGGDGRGRLLATRNYDDGQCHQINGGPISTERQTEFKKQPDLTQGDNLWCQTDVQLPDDVEEGTMYTLYWVWNWATLDDKTLQTSEDGIFPLQGQGVSLPEIYTSAADILVVGGPKAANLDIKANFANGPGTDFDSLDFGQRAIKDQLRNSFQVKVDGVDLNPKQGGAPPSNSGSSPAPVDSSPDEGPAVVDSPSVVTVTVTAPATFITTFVTVTVAASEPTQTADEADVTPEVDSAAQPTIPVAFGPPASPADGVVNNAPVPAADAPVASTDVPVASADTDAPVASPEATAQPTDAAQPSESGPAYVPLPEDTDEAPAVVGFMPRGRRRAA